MQAARLAVAAVLGAEIRLPTRRSGGGLGGVGLGGGLGRRHARLLAQATKYLLPGDLALQPRHGGHLFRPPVTCLTPRYGHVSMIPSRQH